MNPNPFLIILIFTATLFKANAQEIDLYTCRVLDHKNVIFISVSENYPLSEHPDSLALPNIEKMGIESSGYFKLDSIYRERFHAKTKISNTDKLFIYDYECEKLVEFKVKNLSIVAKLNGYASEDDWPFPQYYYLIGFEIDKNKLTGFGNYFSNALVYIGKNNPFVQRQLKQIEWKSIEPEDFPFERISSEVVEYFKKRGYKIGKNHKFNTENFNYYLQELVEKKENILFGKRLVVINEKTNEKIYENIYYLSEGSEFKPLGYQWTGYLFENKPPVIFGFQWHSFGCPKITFLDSSLKPIRILCDNRH